MKEQPKSGTALARITIASDLSMLPPLKGFTRALAEGIGFSGEEVAHVELGLEECFVNVVELGFSGAAGQTFEVIFEQIPTGLTIRFKEKGLPFSPGRLPDYSPDDLGSESADAGLGLFLMKAFMDEVAFVRLGREGQEIRLTKHLPERHIRFLLQSAGAGATTTSNEPVSEQPAKFDLAYAIRPMLPGEAVEVSTCAYRSYGYTYEDFIYYPDVLNSKIEEGLLYSLVAVTDRDAIMGHAALKFSTPNAPIAESGVAFVNPQFRRYGLFKEFNTKFIEHAGRIGLHGLFGRAVTSHIASQRLAAGLGYTSCGLFLGMFPDDLDFKQIAGHTTQRESLILSFLKMKQQSAVNIYPPTEHKEMIARLFRSFDLPVHMGSSAPAGGADTLNPIRMQVEKNNVLNTLEIKVERYGKDTVHELSALLRAACRERTEVVHLWLDLEDPLTEQFSPHLEELGFFFGGVLPLGIFGRHALILQYLNNVPVDFERIKTCTHDAAELLAYIRPFYGSSGPSGF